ncbi:MAG: ATP-binding protein [Candidatus Auribacterota bacterium]
MTKGIRNLHPVVAIGVSKENLSSLNRFLNTLPEHTGMTLIIVPYPDQDTPDIIGQINSLKPKRSFYPAKHNTRLKPNHMYIVQENVPFSLSNGKLVASEEQMHETTLGHMFRSIAKTQGNKAIGILLSGSGSHALSGLSEIKAAGGRTFAHAHRLTHDDSSHCNGDGHCVDMFLTPEQIARELARLVHQHSIENIPSPNDQKRLMDKAKISRIFADAIVNSISESLLILNSELNVIEANKIFYNKFDTTVKDTEQKLIYELCDHQWNIPELKHALEELLPISKSLRDFEISRDFLSIGHRIMLLNARQIILDEIGLPLILLTIEDITQRRTAEKQMEEMAKFPLENPNPVMRISFDGTIIYTNQPADFFLAQTGLRNGSLISKKWQSVIQETIATGKPVRIEEDLNHGETFCFSFAPLIQSGYVNIYGMDITDRKKAEREKQRLMDEMAVKQKELEHVNQELDGLMAILSHDLRSPIQTLQAYGKLLREKVYGQIDNDSKHFIDRIQHTAYHMNTLLSDLLSLSKVNKIKNPYEEFHVNDLIVSVRESVESDINRFNVELIVRDTMPVIYSDRVKLREVFLNLINNAIKYSSKIPNQHPVIEIGYTQKENCHEFYVKDNGIGIEPKFHDKIFELFVRLHSRTEYDGTGAGLNITRKIMNSLNGKIWVRSEIGQGAAFYFTVPVLKKD